jgi:hypothetical protein
VPETMRRTPAPTQGSWTSGAYRPATKQETISANRKADCGSSPAPSVRMSAANDRPTAGIGHLLATTSAAESGRASRTTRSRQSAAAPSTAHTATSTAIAARARSGRERRRIIPAIVGGGGPPHLVLEDEPDRVENRSPGRRAEGAPPSTLIA